MLQARLSFLIDRENRKPGQISGIGPFVNLTWLRPSGVPYRVDWPLPHVSGNAVSEC